MSTMKFFTRALVWTVHCWIHCKKQILALCVQHSETQEKFSTSSLKAWYFLLSPCTCSDWVYEVEASLSVGSRVSQLIFLHLALRLSLVPALVVLVPVFPRDVHGSVPTVKSCYQRGGPFLGKCPGLALTPRVEPSRILLGSLNWGSNWALGRRTGKLSH